MHHGSHHHHSRSTRYIAWGFLLLAFVVLAAGVADFIYHASATSDCFVDNQDPYTGAAKPRQAVESDKCRELILARDTHQRLDAVGVLLGVVLLIGAAVNLSKARRRTKRLVLGIEAVVIILTFIYGLLWNYAIR